VFVDASEPSHGLSPVCLRKAEVLNRSRWKRGGDVVLATIGLAFLAPLLALIALAIWIEDPGPVLFRQLRYGKDGSTFRIFKFRTMTVRASQEEFKPAEKADDRVTRLGRFLRRTNLDELPQLFNVVLGDMSLVGPRPHAVAHDDQFRPVIPNLMSRYLVRPGITGWAQVNGFRGSTHTSADMKNRLDCDLWYVENWSPWLDLIILLTTLFHPSARRNAY
jgi:exopolysaccharide biosynthesis polyprenyl glycosylphosphotransferase